MKTYIIILRRDKADMSQKYNFPPDIS